MRSNKSLSACGPNDENDEEKITPLKSHEFLSNFFFVVLLLLRSIESMGHNTKMILVVSHPFTRFKLFFLFFLISLDCMNRRRSTRHN